MIQKIVSFLDKEKIGNYSLKESMKKHTTWKIGGVADLLIEPENIEKIKKLISFLNKNEIKWKVIGKGSNLLMDDKRVDGVIIKLNSTFESLRIEGEKVKVGGAYSLINLSIRVGKEGLTGLEFIGGVPGTVGGALVMNAGAHGSDVSKVLESAKVIDEKGNELQIEANEMEFSYRNSILQRKNWIVTEATFSLKYGNKEKIAETMAYYKKRRIETQPLQLPCAGSVFRNPEGNYSAKLIEESGLKGYRIGDAQISTKHANFIINLGNAKTEDIISLIEHAKKIVKENYGIELITEIKIFK